MPRTLRGRERHLVAFALLAGIGAAGCAAILDISGVPAEQGDGGTRDGQSLADGGNPLGDDDAASGSDAGGGHDSGDAAPPDAAPPGDASTWLPAPAGAVGFGKAVAFSPDGKWLAVSAPGGDGAVPLVQLYGSTDGGQTWTAGAQVTAETLGIPSGRSFGSALAFGVIEAGTSEVGMVLAIGAPVSSGSAGDGDVFLLPLSATGAPGLARSRSVPGAKSFGASVAYSGSGTSVPDTLFVGAPDAGSTGAGLVYVSEADGGFTTMNAATSGSLGASLAGSASGTTVLAGAPATFVSMTGEAFASSYAAIGALQAPALMQGNSSSTAAFGAAVALSPDGALAAVGDPQVDSGAGAVTLYVVTTKPDPLATLRTSLPAPPRAAQYGAALAMGTDWLAIGAPAEPGGGAVYLCPLAPDAGACVRVPAPPVPGEPVSSATIGTALAVSPVADVAALSVGPSDSGGLLLVH